MLPATHNPSATALRKSPSASSHPKRAQALSTKLPGTQAASAFPVHHSKERSSLVFENPTQLAGDCPSSTQQMGTTSYPNTLQSYLPRPGSLFIIHKATILKMYLARSETTQTGMFCCESVIQKENNATPTIQHHGLSPLCYGASTTQELLKTANYRLICTSQQHLQSAIRKPIFKLPALTILILISL